MLLICCSVKYRFDVAEVCVRSRLCWNILVGFQNKTIRQVRPNPCEENDCTIRGIFCVQVLVTSTHSLELVWKFLKIAGNSNKSLEFFDFGCFRVESEGDFYHFFFK